ncbi:MAG: 3-oxoacyl-[acyl-carrier-protein] reductase [Chloroflexi bacterium]|nr:3-oxoacyl-[acyl-carrier-protein] reductase [Chloroflexota bacterium]
MTSGELQGKVALVTGASRGIGKAVALKLSSLGAKLAINHIAPEKANADAVVAILAQQGGEALALEADIRNSEAVKNMVQAITDKWGTLDILVNNAGITKDTLVLRMSDEAWDDVLDINLRGAFVCTRAALRPMVRQKSGRIVSMSSISGIMGTAGQGNYSASKAGLIGFTKSVAREVGGMNITVNAIAPGFIMTDMTDRLPQERKDAILSMVSLRRFGKPEEVAELIAFLASERAGYITGQVIGIDGGM